MREEVHEMRGKRYSPMRDVIREPDISRGIERKLNGTVGVRDFGRGVLF